MEPTRTLLLALMASLALGWGWPGVPAAPPDARADDPRRPDIRKVGTLDLDMVEATPVVFKDRLYRFEYVRKDYKPNTTDGSYFRFIDVETGEATPAFAHGYDLGCAYAEGGSMWAFGVDQWDGTKIVSFRSTDLKSWEEHPALELPGWGLFNTSVCKAGDRHIMAIEVGRPPEVVGIPFTARFAESSDLKSWKLLPEDRVFTKERYSACPTIRSLDGFFYMTYLETKPGPRFETHIVRSPDLIHWESSPLNPVLVASDEDRRIANPRLTTEQRKKVAGAVDRNNSNRRPVLRRDGHRSGDDPRRPVAGVALPTERARLVGVKRIGWMVTRIEPRLRIQPSRSASRKHCLR